MPPSVFECRKFSVYLSACKIKLKLFSQFINRYLFSVSISASCLLLLPPVDCIFRFVTYVKEELLDIQFMLVNYITKLTRDNADSNVYHMKKTYRHST